MGVTKIDRRGFAKRIAELRAQHELTQAQLGKRVGVSGTCVWNWERGNTFPRSASLNKLAQALGTSAEYLSTGKGPAAANNDGVPGASRPLGEIITEARETVAQAAGVPVSKVRIVLDLGD